MADHYFAKRGALPLLVSFPHDGAEIPDDITVKMTDAGRASTDTDWHVAQLYEFLNDIDVTTVRARWSRYVIDLNRSASGEALYPGKFESALCPVQTFAGEELYASNAPDNAEVSRRVETYWSPYHTALRAEISRLRQLHGDVILWDAHSIRGEVENLFEGRLPDLNFGTNDQCSAMPGLGSALLDKAIACGYNNSVLNGRFKGGHITRYYGQPDAGVHAVQLEINQQIYLQDENQVPPVMDDNKRQCLSAVLGQLIDQALVTVTGG